MIKILVFFLTIFSFSLYAEEKVLVNQESFIEMMAEKHQFNKADLTNLINIAKKSQVILDTISRPAEKKLVWHEYKNIFLKEKRINEGVEFLNKHRDTLDKAEEKFGVPAEIIVAIIGVETFYGRITGKYRVIDALNTLAFYYPKRADFFRSELEQYLLLVREQGFDPLTLMGSYAGAMGIPQFISSSYRHYAYDFDGDNVIDIWDNPVDVIGSVANYFHLHGWKNGERVIEKAEISGDMYQDVLIPGLKPDLNASEIEKYGIHSSAMFGSDEKLKLLSFEQINGPEYWLARQNFYVITRYNHSELYAMAVFQLASAIKKLNSSN